MTKLDAGKIKIKPLDTSSNDLIGKILKANGKRVSNTIEYTTWPFCGIDQGLTRLQLSDPIKYDYIKRHGLVIDLGNGMYFPDATEMKKHGLHTFIGIDLRHRADSSYEHDGIRLIRKSGDFFSVLESLDDGSIPCVHISMIDAYILNGEGERLDELLRQKMSPHGSILQSS